jgi:hypothetical protein
MMRAKCDLPAVFLHSCIRLTQVQREMVICRNKLYVMSVIQCRIIIIVE